MSANDSDATPVGIVLIHGYLGSPLDFEPLVDGLANQPAIAAIDCLRLPGHGERSRPPFDEAGFLTVLDSAIERQRAAGRRLVLIGHSTGGNLLLGAIARRLAADGASLDNLLLVVLCATPPRIDLGYATRWKSHTADPAIAIDDVGALVCLVNRQARRAPLAVPSPVLIVHGDADELVPIDDAALWNGKRLLGARRILRINGAKHHLFSGQGAAQAVDAVRRAIDDACRRAPAALGRALYDRAPGLESFCAAWPDTLRQVENSPAGWRAVGQATPSGAVARSEPTLANIEITTRCTLGCAACARTQRKVHSRLMSRDNFCRVLESLPHAYRIVLVGLGEPLLHPEVTDFIRLASGQGRHVSLVTNAMNLDLPMAQSLCDCGLSNITFSLDAVSQATAQRVRQGSDMCQISANIRTLLDERQRRGSPMTSAAFTALSLDNIGEFEAIVDFVADHGIDALMVTDLNFQSNQSRALHGSFTDEHGATLRSALKRALARRLPVLSVLGLEEFALDARYLDYLLLRGQQLARRSPRHANCLSPWQTAPVSVDGTVTVCDCQPDAVLGNIHHIPLSAWWNGAAMREQRRRMLSDSPPAACLVCPRF